MLSRTQRTNRTRYDWLFDKQPSELRFTEDGDVSGSVQVGMKPETALPTPVIMPFPVALVDVTTRRTFLARKSWVDIDNDLADIYRFVVDKRLQLAESPISEHSIEIMSKSLFSLNTKGFQGDYIKRLPDYLFSDAMVHVSHKTFLFASEFLQLALGRASSFGLQNHSIMLIAGLGRSNLIAINEFIVRQNSVVVDACVDAENFTVLSGDSVWGICFSLHPDNQFPTIEGYVGGLDFPTEVFLEVVWNIDWKFYPAMNTGKRYYGLISVERECSHVVSNCAIFPLDWQPLELFTPEHLGGTIFCGGREGGRKPIYLSNRVVSHVVEVEFVDGFSFKSSLENVVGGFVEYSYSFDNLTIGLCVESNCSFHSETSLADKVYKYSRGVAESIISYSTIPPTTEVRGFPYGGIL